MKKLLLIFVTIILLISIIGGILYLRDKSRKNTQNKDDNDTQTETPEEILPITKEVEFEFKQNTKDVSKIDIYMTSSLTNITSLELIVNFSNVKVLSVEDGSAFDLYITEDPDTDSITISGAKTEGYFSNTANLVATLKVEDYIKGESILEVKGADYGNEGSLVVLEDKNGNLNEFYIDLSE